MSGRPSTDRASRIVRDPDVWLSRVAWAVIVLSLLQILLFGVGRDQGIYAVVAVVCATAGIYAGGLVVMKRGTATVSAEELRAAILADAS